MHASVFLRAWGGARQRLAGGSPGSPGLRLELLVLGANIGEVRLEVAALPQFECKERGNLTFERFSCCC